jgi:hypothetical protein
MTRTFCIFDTGMAAMASLACASLLYRSRMMSKEHWQYCLAVALSMLPRICFWQLDSQSVLNCSEKSLPEFSHEQTISDREIKTRV